MGVSEVGVSEVGVSEVGVSEGGGGDQKMTTSSWDGPWPQQADHDNMAQSVSTAGNCPVD